MQLIMASVAGSTSAAYEASWKHWMQFRTLRGEDPFLSGTSPRREEEVLLTYITFLRAVQGNACSTIKNKGMAIRQHHLVAGLGDPLLSKPRMWLAFKGLKRISPVTARKFPVTVDMLREVRSMLSPFDAEGGVDRSRAPYTRSHRNDAVLWSSITTGFFWLLCASEYGTHDERGGLWVCFRWWWCWWRRRRRAPWWGEWWSRMGRRDGRGIDEERLLAFAWTLAHEMKKPAATFYDLL